MQIEDKIFIDIAIPDIGKSKFLNATDVFAFKMVESAGTAPPWIGMTIRVEDVETVNSFKQNNKINISFGATENDADTFPLIIEVSKINNDPSGLGWRVEFAGFLYEKSYKVNQVSQAYYGNSLDVVKSVYKDEMNKPVETNVNRVLENEVVWRRVNQSACSFLVETLLHMRLYPSFPLFAINKYGTLILKDFKQTCSEGPKFTITYDPSSEYHLCNTFNVKNDRDMYNAFSGYKKRIEVTNSSTGAVSFPIADNAPILSSTQVSEGLDVGSTVSSNEIQSANVHDYYKETFVYNTNNQVALSCIRGEALLLGRYFREINPLDLVRLETGVGRHASDGLYLVETIETQVNFTLGMILTKLTLTRDNMNYIENYVKKTKGVKIQSQFMQKLCAAISDLRRAYAVARQFIDGSYMGRLLGFIIETKRNLLRMFSISGVSLDFSGSARLLKSYLLLGNSLMNSLLGMLFPAEVSYVFRDYLIWKPSLRGLVSKYVNEFVPVELQSVINSIIEALDSTTTTLNSIAKDNGIIITKADIKAAQIEDLPQLPTITKTITELTPEEIIAGGAAPVTPPEVVPVIQIEPEETPEEEIPSDVTIAGAAEEEDMNPIIEDKTEDSQQKVIEIIEDFTERTAGVDLPFPIITLNESQMLLPDVALKEYIANQTIVNLTNLGYLENIDADEFKEVLLGDKDSKQENMPFTMISQIKVNVGSSYNYRFWGTYDELINLTDFHIRSSYKDKYRTLPCTKFINASKDAKIFFACPKAENDVRFFINSKRVEVGEQDTALMDKFEINLGYKDSSDNQIPYLVYYTKKGYNSSSVLFEVKQGGMV